MKSRRDFLKIAGLSAFALGTASALTLATGSKASALPAGTAPAKGSYTNEPDALHAKRWAMVIDTRKFTSPEHFQRVIDACHHAHNVPTIPGNQDVKWIWTDKYAHVFPDDVNAYMPEKFLHGDFLLLCNHCEDPACVNNCPSGAMHKDTATGIVSVNQDVCIACGYCAWVCPYGAPSMDDVDHVMSKCTFCAERVAAGAEPYCVAACPANARVFGDLNDPESAPSKLMQERHAEPYLAEAGTHPSVYYI